jgi:hypothetical protein
MELERVGNSLEVKRAQPIPALFHSVTRLLRLFSEADFDTP